MSRMLRASAIMAAGTMVSRVTGFVRTMVLATAIGTAAMGDAYNAAYAIPYSILDLLLLGVLSSVVVPMIVRAQQQDPDGGQAYEQRLLTLATAVLIVVAGVAVLAAPTLIDLYTDWDRGSRQFEVAVRLAQFILPQLAFFGVGAVAGAILNTRDRFGAPMWAPVVNNLVVIGVLVAYHLMVNNGDDVNTVTNGELALLGLGTTAGIIVQATVLVLALRRVGFRFIARFDLRNARLGEMGQGRRLDHRLRGRHPARVHAHHQPVQLGGQRGAWSRHHAVHPGVPALPASVRRHRRLGDHGHAAQDEPGGDRRAVR